MKKSRFAELAFVHVYKGQGIALGLCAIAAEHPVMAKLSTLQKTMLQNLK